MSRRPIKPATHLTRIRQLRALASLDGWTQEDLARATGIARDRVLRIERGYAVPTVLEARRIAKALGVTVDALGTRPPVDDRDG